MPSYPFVPPPPSSGSQSGNRHDRLVRYVDQLICHTGSVDLPHEYIGMKDRGNGYADQEEPPASHRNSGSYVLHKNYTAPKHATQSLREKGKDQACPKPASKIKRQNVTTYSVKMKPKLVHRPRSPIRITGSRPKPRRGLLTSIWRKFIAWCTRMLRKLSENPLLCAGAMAGMAVVGGMALWNFVRLGGHECNETTLAGKYEDDLNIDTIQQGEMLTGRSSRAKTASVIGERIGVQEDVKSIKSESTNRRQKTKSKGLLNQVLSGPSPTGDWWFDEFVEFASSKGNAFTGLMKIIQLLVNHWYRLSQSMVPRVLNILLDVYFLDIKNT